MQKKIISLVVLPLMIINFGILSNVVDQDSGKARLIHIMSNPETGTAAYNKKHVKHAETQNLADDLNVEEIAEVSGCKTITGRSFLSQAISSPVNSSDRDTVLARQKVVRALVENPAFKEKVGQLLKCASLHETGVIDLLSEGFVGRACPMLQALELTKKQSPLRHRLLAFFTLNSTMQIVYPALGIVSVVGSLLGSVAFSCRAASLSRSCHSGRSDYLGFHAETKAMAGFFFTAIQLSYNLYKGIEAAKEKRSKLHALSQLTGIAETFESLCEKHHVKSQFNLSAIKDPQGIALVKELKHARYQAKNPVVFMAPLVHPFLYKLYQQEKHLAGLFACIAEMDSYNALATKIVESQNDRNKFCFVDFVDQEKPLLDARGFWNMLVKNAVPSNLSESKHMILTGPNAGGKSTIVRALLQNIILAQSYGVAAAESFKFTMFDIIHSYFNISDDILKGESTFDSELKRAKGISQIIKSLDPHKKFFFALDELFKSTVAEAGEECAYKFIRRIAGLARCVQFVYATHFNKLKKLGNGNALCANYKVDAPVKNSEGKLTYPYTLSQGSSNFNVALDLAREADLFE